MSNVIDLTRIQTDPPKVFRKFRRMNARGVILRSGTPGGNVIRRNPIEVNSITIHQTACRFGVSKALLRQAGGDEDAARHMRALGVACHVLAFDCGHAVHSCPFDWYVYHGNGLNAYSLGLEIEGHFSGVWRPGKNQVSSDLCKAARDALKYMVELGLNMGMPLKWIHAHRQSSASRRGDPGGEIWRRIVLDYAVPVLGLKTNISLIVGDGRPIPAEWDEAGVGKF